MKKGDTDWIYSDAIQLHTGQRQLLFPIAEFDNGLYYTSVKNKGVVKFIQLAYW